MTHRFVAFVLALSALVFSGAARADVRIEAQCNVNTGCVFTNVGDSVGSGCAHLAVVRSDGQQLRSGLVCSGRLEPNSTGQAIPVQFESNVLAFCAEGSCRARVDLTSVRDEGGGFPLGLLVPIVVLASAAWAYSDAKKLGARAGLIDAPFGLGPGGWALAIVAMWIVAFPAYLLRRGDLARAAERAREHAERA